MSNSSSSSDGIGVLGLLGVAFFEIVNGRWCVNLFCGFSDVDAMPTWTTISVQQFYKEALLADGYGLQLREKCRQYNIREHKGRPCEIG